MSNEKGLKSHQIVEKNANRTNHLLGVAINAYKHCPKLNNAVKDVQDFADLMKEKFAFKEKNISLLYDEAATGSNIIEKLDDLSTKLTNNDNLIIYFSGHGALHPRQSKGYWIPINARQDKYFDYLANTVIKDYLSVIDAHHIFLIADSCFSGALFTKGAKDVGIRLEKNPSRWGLTSGQKEIVLDGKPGENSPFAKSLLYHLENATRPIGVQELCANVLETTAANAKQTPLGEPLQVAGHKNGQFVFRLKKDEGRDWAKAQKIGTIAAFQQFLQLYPKGLYAQNATNAIKEIKAENVWQRIKNSKKSIDFARYKKNFPNSKYTAIAHQAFLNTEEDEVWQRCKRGKRLSLYQNYLLDFPEGRYAEEAQTAIEAIFNADKEEAAKKEAQRLEAQRQKEEAAKKKAERLEAQRQKEEAAKKEAQRLEAQRQKEEAAKKEAEENSYQTPSEEKDNRKKILLFIIGLFAIVIIGWIIINKSGKTTLSDTQQQRYNHFYKEAQEEETAKAIEATLINYEMMQEIIKTDSITKKIKDLELEKQAYSEAIENENATAINDYVANYPNGFFVEELQNKLKIIEATTESEAWKQSETTNTIEAYQAFLQKYPNGNYHTTAEEKIAALQTETDEAAWKMAKEANTEEAYKTYLEIQQAGQYKNEAAKAIQKLQDVINDKAAKAKDDNAWKAIKNKTTKSPFQNYLRNFSDGQYRSQAQRKIKDIEQTEKKRLDLNAWNTAKNRNTIASYDTYLKNHSTGDYRRQAIAAKKRITLTKDPFAGQMKKITGGTFTMGQSDPNIGCDGCSDDEQPPHPVTLSTFYMSQYEVTQKQWRDIMGTTISQQRDKADKGWSLYGEGDNYPMYYVSWNEVQEFIKKLNTKTGKNYRLPTEAEWEYAAKGGQNYKYAGSDNINSVAWYDDNSNSTTHPVGQKKPNAYGLYDMTGNVWEWCSDWYSSTYYKNSPDRNPSGASSGANRVIRGGSWYDIASSCRVAYRNSYAPDNRYDGIGFRLVSQ